MSFIMDLINKIFNKNSVKMLADGNFQSQFSNEKKIEIGYYLKPIIKHH